MLKSIPSLALGGISLTLLSLNTVWWCSILYVFVVIKLIIPINGFRRRISRLLVRVAEAWVAGNSFLFQTFHRVKWDIQGLECLSPAKSYLVVSNHRSWADIFVLQHVFRRRIPFLKFFLKKELIWVPFLGIAWWALDFPFLKRYSREFLKKHPEFRGRDMAATRKSCEKFKSFPISVMNFVEGTRFTPQKHQNQNAPFHHLLMPKAGGISLVFSNMGDYLAKVVDVTIVYPKNKPPVHFWQLLSGKIPGITVRVQTKPVPDNVAGRDYEEDTAFREKIQEWVNRVWHEKDQQIEDILNPPAVSKA